jgi:hypothetical protein
MQRTWLVFVAAACLLACSSSSSNGTTTGSSTTTGTTGGGTTTGGTTGGTSGGTGASSTTTTGGTAGGCSASGQCRSANPCCQPSVLADGGLTTSGACTPAGIPLSQYPCICSVQSDCSWVATGYGVCAPIANGSGVIAGPYSCALPDGQRYDGCFIRGTEMLCGGGSSTNDYCSSDSRGNQFCSVGCNQDSDCGNPGVACCNGTCSSPSGKCCGLCGN